MKTQIKEITPDWASKVLQTRNPHNRKLSQSFVERLARDIRAGAWITHHQGIAFNEAGDLIDGQHRLAACVLAGIPIRIQVTTDVPATHKLNGTTINTFETIDAGKVRSVAQMLGLRGWKNCNTVAAVARNIANMFISGDNSHWLAITTPQCEKILYRFGKHINHVVEIARSGSMCRPSAGVLAAIAFYRTSDTNKADDFLQQLCSLNGIQKGQPAYALASWLKNHTGWNNPRQSICVTASAIHRFDKNLKIEKLYGNEESIKWLKELDKASAEYIRQVMEIA